MSSTLNTSQQILCSHCGEKCVSARIKLQDKAFCCEGCKMVYQIINQNGLCDYYNLNDRPGITQRIPVRKHKFDFLDDRTISSRLVSFQNDSQTHVSFYLPQMHCSSCLYLLENLPRLDPGIISARVNFARKEIDIVLMNHETSLRKAAELLTSIGYEPYISLNDLNSQRPAIDKSMIYQLGVAGFCFGNIMLMSFPEYLGIDASEEGLRTIFRWMNLALAIPVFIYSALPFYVSAWKSLKHKFLNIDAPIALAIIITFVRSAWEVLTHTGGGYFDSMTGIVFFMLAGRILQDKTYRQLSFDRDYTSYFPVAVPVIKDGREIVKTLPEIKAGDTLLIHHGELIPVDGILTKGRAFIDYSFVTGESLPVLKDVGEIVYAGGKQTDGSIEVLAIKEVTQSYLTRLWNQDSKGESSLNEHGQKSAVSFVHLLSRYFTYIVLLIAVITAVYWGFNDMNRLWPSVTSIFIIACPCALLLSNTFTNGNILSILGRNHFYLRNAQVIENIAATSHIVFDKTGTLTSSDEQDIDYIGDELTASQEQQIVALANHSNHPLSRALVKHVGEAGEEVVSGFKETAGFGIEGFAGGHYLKMGSSEFVHDQKNGKNLAAIYVSIDNKFYGYYRFHNHYRDSIPLLVGKLRRKFNLSVISGDTDGEKEQLKKIFGENTIFLFQQKPEDKLNYIQALRQDGKKVMMIGDGLNDAGALKESDIGIAVSDQVNNFTPASDAIIDARRLSRLGDFIDLCKANKKIVKGSFALSIVYNVIGLYFAVKGDLAPLVAAILMPASSLSILLVTFGSSSLFAGSRKL